MIRGFYYDSQLNNELLSVGLYPNTKIEGGIDSPTRKDGVINWVHADNLETENGTNATEIKNSKGETEKAAWKYSKDPICTSTINQDFQIEVANTWSGAGGDAIGTLWDTFKRSAPYARFLGGALKDIEEASKSFADNAKTDLEKKLGDGVAWLAGVMSKTQDNQAKYLDRSLVVQGTRFVYFSSSEIGFGNNLGMKFTIFPKIDNGVFKTVPDQIREFLPWVDGDFVGIEAGTGSTTANEFIKTYVSWQCSPGGFQADLTDVDVVQKGTLKLRIGAFYAIENLVIGNASFSFSKEMVKNPMSTDESSYLTPLYCDVNLLLKPASKYSSKSLEKAITGKFTDSYRTTLVGNMQKSLTAVDTSNYK